MVDFKKFEAITIYNMIKIMHDFVDKKNISVIDLMKSRKTPMNAPIEESMDTHMICMVNNLLFEIITLTNETFAKKGLDFSNPQVREMLNEIKKHLPTEYKSLNGAEFLKIIRSSISHNSAEIRNLKSNPNSYQVTLPKKGVLETAKPIFTLVDFVNISLAYDKSRNLSHTYGEINWDDEIDTVDKLLKEHKNKGSFSKFITVKYENNEEMEWDSYQDAAYLRFLIKHKHTINKFGNFGYFAMRYFPHKENKLNNYEYKYHLSSAIDRIALDYNKVTCNDLINQFKREELGGLLMCVDKDFMKSIVYSSLVFNIVSSRTNDELAQVFESADIQIEPENIRHVRNSFIHGRYFYNFKDGFELYDGQKEMEHFFTLTFEDIEKLFHVFYKDQILTTKLTRLNNLNNNIFK